MGKEMVGVPTMRGMGSSFADFGLGALGGLIFILAYKIFGALGVLAAPLIAGSMIKGSRGSTIATMAGFMILAMGGLAMGTGGGAGGNEEVI